MILALALFIQEIPGDAWKEFKEGSWAKYAKTSKAGKKDVTETLKKKGEEQLDMERAGEGPPSYRIDAKFHGRRLDVGTETLTVGKKTYACKIVQLEEMQGTIKSMSSKLWLSGEAPGGVVRVEVKERVHGAGLPAGTWTLAKEKEEVTVGKKKLACWKMETEGGSAWYSKEVPGWLVKLEVRREDMLGEVEEESVVLTEWGTK